MRLFALVPLLVLAGVARADPSGSALYPPGLLPLINRANALLSTGQFSDAAKAYTEAIGEQVKFGAYGPLVLIATRRAITGRLSTLLQACDCIFLPQPTPKRTRRLRQSPLAHFKLV